MAKDKVVKMADELEKVMDEIDALKEQFEPQLKLLSEKEEAIRGEIVKSLLSKGVDYIRTTSGMAFGMVKGRVTYKVKQGSEKIALDWAIKEYPAIVKIGAGDLSKVAQRMLHIPEFIERTESEPHLAVRTQES